MRAGIATRSIPDGAGRRPCLVMVTVEFPFGRGETLIGPEVAELEHREVDLKLVQRNGQREVLHRPSRTCAEGAAELRPFSAATGWGVARMVLRSLGWCLVAAWRVLRAGRAHVQLKSRFSDNLQLVQDGKRGFLFDPRKVLKNGWIVRHWSGGRTEQVVLPPLQRKP